MKREHIEQVRPWPPFAAMAPESFESLMRGAYLKTFPAGFELFAEGEQADFLHVLVDGRVELHASWRGRETTMAILTPGASFVLASTVRDAPYLKSARTLERSRIVMVPSEDVRSAIATDPTFAVSMIDELARCYRASIRHSKEIKLRTSTERLANWLLRQSRRAGNADRFPLPLEKRRIAAYLGMTPESLSRGLKALAAHGVKVEGGEVVIEDRARLENYASPTPLIDQPEDPVAPTGGG